MDKKEMKAIIEALLFTWGDPLEGKEISKILNISYVDFENIIDEMIDEFSYDMRGLKISKIKNSYQIGTKPEYFQWIKELSKPKEEKTLSNAGLETLSIIAYRQPVTKGDVEAIRGVKCDKAIDTLLGKNLIEEVGRLERIGRPIIYGTTDIFLKTFGIENLDQLPEINFGEESVEK